MRLSALLLTLLLASPAGANPVQLGTADLTGWNRTTSVSLDGSWKFWPGIPGQGPARSIDVPGLWASTLGQPDGAGVYRLTVVLPDPVPESLALSVPVVNSAVRVLWNGGEVWKAGVVSDDSRTFEGGRRSGTVGLKPLAGENQLEVQVASFGEPAAGLTESWQLGTLAGLLQERASRVNLDVFVFGCLFVMGLYHLGLFAFRPADRAPLWFGFLSILLGLRGLVLGSVSLADFWPGLGWIPLLKLSYLTWTASALFLGLFIRDLFPQVVPRWFTRAVLAGAGPYTLWVLVAPPAWFTPLLMPFQAFSAFEGLAIAWFLVAAVLRRSRGADLFLAGFLLLFLAGVHDILKTNLALPTPFLSSFGLLAFLVFQSMVMLSKFTAAFADSERYSRHLVRLNSSLERFIPREVLSFLQKESIVEIELGDNCQAPMAVLFADIRDFTTLSETMTPEENFKFINSYLRRMGPVVRRHEGFVDKYMGDGIMALFPGSPSQALDAALELRASLAEYNIHRARSGYTVIRMGIGIHWGHLMLGTIGENQRMDSTVISDTVNAASRLEGLTKKFSRDILVSGETLEALDAEVKGRYRLEYLDEETVKGRSKPVKVFALGPAV